jgi:hypothetical protein
MFVKSDEGTFPVLVDNEDAVFVKKKTGFVI